MRISPQGLVVVAVLVSGCDEEDFIEPLPEVLEITLASDGSEVVTFRDTVDNGTVGNGFEWNGYRWNGYRWNGYRWNGYRWNGYRWNGVAVTNIRFDPGTGALLGDDAQSNTVTLGSADQLDADGDLDDGTITVSQTRVSEIESFTRNSLNFQFQRVQTRVLESASPDVWGPWQDACTDGAGNPTKAVLLKGDWASPTYSKLTGAEADLRTTWACRGAALAKCVEWGYHPEETRSGTPLANHHQACTRMVRADYCGNGDHHTENGTPIDVADSLGIQTHDSTWPIEAAWGPNGALCLNGPRKTYWGRSDALGGCGSIPSCDANSNGNLGDDVAWWFAQGAQLVTRNQPTSLVSTPPAPSDSGG
jgi:hypothetical protein